jgi:DNA-binding NarL/FixJ family response regulator
LFGKTEIQVVAEATNGSEGLKQVAKHKPDVVLLDIQMPGMDGFDVLEQIHAKVPDCRIVMLSAYDNPTYVARAVALGATDFILKGASRQDVISAVTAAAEGKSPCREGQMQKMAGIMGKKQATGEDGIPLTNREAQVLRHVALGLSNKEIGRALTISIETVKEHVQNILRKIAVTDRTQAAVWAVRKGMA